MSETTISVRLGTIMVLVSVLSAAVSGAATYAFTYGYNLRDEQAQQETHAHFQKQIDELKVDHKKYTDLEVGGLRSDWERELNHNK